MNSLNTKRDSYGRVARDRGLRRAQARARRRSRVTGPGQLEIIMLRPGFNRTARNSNDIALDIAEHSHINLLLSTA
jgi:hypothetical protein